MKNKIIIDEENQKDEYKVLFKVDIENKNDSYVVYTKDEKNEEGEVICYAATYEVDNGKQKLEPIENEEILEFLDSILLQVQGKMNKNVGE